MLNPKTHTLAPGVFAGIVRGIEKETLRVHSDGKLALDAHPPALGATLTHPSITTDFSEGLLELITPPQVSWEATSLALHELNQFVYQHLPQGQLLWPGSMPPFLNDIDSIPIANYGKSHVGKMKHIYRKGLVERYGKPMQLIAGLHYNFSFPMDFWQAWLGSNPSQEDISAAYMNLIRHFYDHYWILPYLFGASPFAMSSSIPQGLVPPYLKSFDKNTWVGAYATSLRNSDLGYQNSGQSQLDIQYDSIQAYSRSLLQATTIPEPRFVARGVKKNGRYSQLSDAILQIENEYYNPIRPKQPSIFPERPASGLFHRGIAYIEVRVLDLNPFDPLGLTLSEAYFIDVFLFFCMQQESNALSLQKCQLCRERFYQVVTRGRDPFLKLNIQDSRYTLKQAADPLFDALLVCARVMDRGLEKPIYETAVLNEYRKIEDVSLTPSAQVLSQSEQVGYTGLMLRLAKEQQAFYQAQSMAPDTLRAFQKQAEISFLEVKKLEADSQESFEIFLKRYFNQPL